MTFLLSSQNVFEYLSTQGLLTSLDREKIKIEPKPAKNFNLLLSLSEDCKLLIKQERHNLGGKTAGEFDNEWRVYEFLQQFPELYILRPLISEVLHFHTEDSIIIFKYLTDYSDLSVFYAKENIFPPGIAAAIARVLATIHRSTFNNSTYRDFLTQKQEESSEKRKIILTAGLDRITPEIFGIIPMDGLKFYALYQRYDSLGKAIADITSTYTPSCLTHNDLKLNNILLHNDWEQNSNHQTSLIRLIDWERGSWGDPAFDLGAMVASYLQLWLSSLVVSQSIAIEEALQLAMIPLDKLQPSLAALVSAYFAEFPNILEHRPDFLNRVVQAAGLSLINQILAMIQYQKTFNNTGICMLQVAKSLLCRPEQSIPTIFGTFERELINCSAGILPAQI
ncbi:MAG: aminoglycoside phosphotransferase family protein [Hydrococcus sp. Prado102]|nr:aminoglycoside phosphotransferase family protein [Hydrococcus sp. Prado102]